MKPDAVTLLMIYILLTTLRTLDYGNYGLHSSLWGNAGGLSSAVETRSVEVLVLEAVGFSEGHGSVEAQFGCWYWELGRGA